ncbi:MAG: MaoC family dehydratase N-terminal domain-containing protein [Pseudotabrizicola sp.]|uniref:FAS1-like dehydratase domain-containing protein n=1 Tax=Pseudotabrizicola sp. TaxID=2939647 RepID=UPI002716B374|nr:MaoC family dehydratase N-terminal domain-containing protein [Pseudotabrizicola sp.]MDO9638306.1 MaoC family dehydratase N-terminal domain-containing protein [Pseudotabrizicola sp.]
MTALDIDHLRQWIGRTEQAAEVVTVALVQRYNATFDRTGAVVPGAVAPPMLHLCLAQPSLPTASLGPDGHPARGGFLPPVPLPRRMWAGGALEFTDDIRVGEVLRRVSNIRDVTLKEGRSGALCFVTVDHAIYSGARAVIRERQDIVYRAADPPGAASVPGPAATPMGAFHRSVTPSAPLLFRYSALTFNGHRIHYDLAYARDVEGYPGLVVHGPMQATMLVLYAQELRGKRPARFSFRNLSPVFDTDDFTLNADEDSGALRLWVRRADGAIAMEARAEW